MILYLVLGTSAAPSCLVGTQADARKLARERGTSWEREDVPVDKNGLIAYINKLKADVSAEMHRSYDHGYLEATVSTLEHAEPTKIIAGVRRPVSSPVDNSRILQSIQTDEAFDALPLARQLDLAARAMENARGRL